MWVKTSLPFVFTPDVDPDLRIVASFPDQNMGMLKPWNSGDEIDC